MHEALTKSGSPKSTNYFDFVKKGGGNENEEVDTGSGQFKQAQRFIQRLEENPILFDDGTPKLPRVIPIEKTTNHITFEWMMFKEDKKRVGRLFGIVSVSIPDSDDKKILVTSSLTDFGFYMTEMSDMDETINFVRCEIAKSFSKRKK